MDTRYHNPAPAIRRPASLHMGPTFTATASSFNDPILPRQPAQRILQSQPPVSVAPQFYDRLPLAEPTTFPRSLSISSRNEEPVAFLRTDFVIAKSSAAFNEAIGNVRIAGMHLSEVLAPVENEKVAKRQAEFLGDVDKNRPLLPPIYVREETEAMFSNLSFSREQLDKMKLDVQESLTFESADKQQQRTYMVKMGLNKIDAIFFIVLKIDASPAEPSLHPSFAYPSPSPRSREQPPYSYHAQHGFSQPTPLSTSLDSVRPRQREATGYGSSTLTSPRQSGPHPMPMVSGFSPNTPAGYGSSPTTRPEYSGPMYHVPRSELPQPTQPSNFPGITLPPIRNQTQPNPATSGLASPWVRDERSNRVGIQSLLKNPEQQNPLP